MSFCRLLQPAEERLNTDYDTQLIFGDVFKLLLLMSSSEETYKDREQLNCQTWDVHIFILLKISAD